jgi:hypothetical protein
MWRRLSAEEEVGAGVERRGEGGVGEGEVLGSGEGRWAGSERSADLPGADSPS